MIPKSGNGFRKRSCSNDKVERDDDSKKSHPALVLLRYKLLRARFRAVPPQHGHRGNRLTIAAMSLRRMVAIEFGMCRSGRKGGSSGSVTVGYGKLREQRGGTRS